jgi:phospholipase C
MMENHSFDNFLGTMPKQRRNGVVDTFTMSPGAVTSWNPDGVVASNPDGTGKFQHAYHMATTCQHSGSPTQEWSASHEQLNGGKLDGFVTCVSYGAPAPAGPVGMAYWNAGDLPVLHSLANAFPVADRWFQSLLGQTDPNRRYLIAASSAGMVNDIAVTADPTLRDIVADATLPLPANGTIFDRLTAFGISWKNYTDNWPLGASPELYVDPDGALDLANLKSFEDFYSDCKAGTLPAYSFLDENYSTQSQENPQDIVLGEQVIYDVVSALASSPSWGKTLLIINYDEHGGYYDHVVPPVALPPDLIGPIVQPGQVTYDGFARFGFRVPALVVSPYAQPNWVTHTVYDHTSILAMTYRDANANDLSGFLDLSLVASGKGRSFEEICPSLDKPAPSVCPATAPKLPPAGSVSDTPA